MIKFHPKTCENLLKCYFYAGAYSFDYFLKVIDILPLSKRFNLEEIKEPSVKEIREKNKDESERIIEAHINTEWRTTDLWNELYVSLKNYLESLLPEDIFKLLSDIFPSSEFKRMQWDKWNHHGEFVKDWRNDLINSLEICNIHYNEEKRQFEEKGNEISLQETIYKTDILKIDFNDTFYKNLVLEINKAYKIGAYTGAFILCRKLIENLVIDILRKKFPPNATNLELYFSTKNRGGRFHDFSVLLDNLELKKNDFGIDKPLIEELMSLIKPFRPNVNSKTHSIIIIGNEGDIKKFEIEKMVSLLVRMEKGI
jgi:hypothetical protein